MSTNGIVFPVQPGKEPVIREIAKALREQRSNYEESRRRCGVSVERAYLQHNPDGSDLLLAYLQADRALNAVMQAMLLSDAALDRYFIERNSEATGIDFRTGLQGPGPELIAQWLAAGASGPRRRGFAFAAPLVPGKTDDGRKFAQEAYVARKAEMNESRLAQNLIREEVFLNQTPNGDVIVVYLEGDDPAASNRRFAESSTPFDRWFKDRCRDIFPPYVDFNQPVPANEELFSWQRS